MNLMQLNGEIQNCTRCPRLIEHCKKIGDVKRKAFEDWNYWAKPVPNFLPEPAKDGDVDVLIVGLAPAAHGANRTGRMFTGDRSGEWLYRVLFRAGLANQPESTGQNDGLRLMNCAITNVAHCAPPGNKPTPIEIENCEPYLEETFRLVKPKVVVALGGIAWEACLRQLHLKKTKFNHAAELQIQINGESCLLIASYHPSQQNTFTGRLTEPMFDRIFTRARRFLESRT